MPTHTFGSLFAGVGGFDLGFEAAGWQCAFQVEWDKHCQQVLARHWPDVPRWSDVSDVDGAELPPVDCINFGSPCQDLSIAGRRAGLDGNRSNLFFEATRIIKEMRHATRNQYPRVAVWENVPGALSSNKGADFSAVLDSLADSGALAIEWAVLDAQHFGVPQRRRRIFLVAVYDPAIARNCGTQILPVTQGSRRNTKKVSTPREEVAGTLGGGSGSRGWSPDTDRMTFVPVKTVIFTAQRVGEPPRVYENTTPSLLSRMGTGGNNVPMIAQDRLPIGFNWANGGGYGNANPGLGITVDGVGPLSTSQVPAIAQSNGIDKIDYAVRRLTPLECERLMGWPDDHTAGQADSHRYKQCGNGVAAPVAQWVAQQLNRIMT
jgi:DNA (cytosine-5)-methyltransferase 1